jgi:hypothetical protein
LSDSPFTFLFRNLAFSKTKTELRHVSKENRRRDAVWDDAGERRERVEAANNNQFWLHEMSPVHWTQMNSHII